METDKPVLATKIVDKKAMERLVNFFSILMEIDQRVKKEETIKNETKIN